MSLVITATFTSESARPGYEPPAQEDGAFSPARLVRYLRSHGYTPGTTAGTYTRTVRAITDVITIDGEHDSLVRQLLDLAEQIDARYPNPDQEELITSQQHAAFTAGARLFTGDDHMAVINSYANALLDAREAEAEARAALRQAALLLVPDTVAEAEFARRAGVDRMAVRTWLGKR